MHTTPSPKDASMNRLAHRRARAKLGWYRHACVYVVVNLVLAFAASRSAHPWALYPLAGWGLGLALHGTSVWLGQPGGALYQRLLARERARLQQQ